MRTLERPEVQENIVKRLATGEPQTAVAHSWGISQAAVSGFANREDIRELIKTEALSLVQNCLPHAVDNIKFLVESMRETTDPKERELGYKATVKLLEIAGIAPSGQPSVVINTFIDNRTEVSPAVVALIRQHASTFPDDPIEILEVGKSEEN